MEQQPKAKKRKRTRKEVPEVCIRVYIKGANPTGYVVRSDYIDGLVGFFIMSRWAMSKIRQIYKQLLVLRIEGATTEVEIPGIRFVTQPSATMVPGKEYSGDKEYSCDVGWITVSVTPGTVLATIHAENADASVSWDITQAIGTELAEVQGNYDSEKEKRHEWFGKYIEAGRTPITDRTGAPRGRKPKADINE